MVCIVIITQIIKENKFSREKITEPAVVNYCDTVIKEKEIVWEKAVRRTKRAERSASECENRILFAGLVSVVSVSAFPLNSRCCGQLFQCFWVSAFLTNTRALKKKNPQIFVLPAQESEDFGRSGGILPRAEKQSTGLFFAAVAAALFESRPSNTIPNRKRTPRCVLFLFGPSVYNGFDEHT